MPMALGYLLSRVTLPLRTVHLIISLSLKPSPLFRIDKTHLLPCRCFPKQSLHDFFLPCLTISFPMYLRQHCIHSVFLKELRPRVVMWLINHWWEWRSAECWQCLTTGSLGEEKVLICSTGWLPGCNYLHPGQFHTTNVTSWAWSGEGVQAVLWSQTSRL